jgi:hypothetical protein
MTYKMFRGTEWKNNTLLTAFLFPGAGSFFPLIYIRPCFALNSDDILLSLLIALLSQCFQCFSCLIWPCGRRVLRVLCLSEHFSRYCFCGSVFPSRWFVTERFVKLNIADTCPPMHVPFLLKPLLEVVVLIACFYKVFLGSFFGYKRETITFPVRTNQIPRAIPVQAWYMNPILTCLLGKLSLLSLQVSFNNRVITAMLLKWTYMYHHIVIPVRVVRCM